MSIDSYFCFCCLSTNDLNCLFSNDKDTKFVKMLKELFALKPSQDYDEDSYICEECSRRLKEAHAFKTQIFATINILQVNGLVALNKVNGELIITRVSNEPEEETKLDVKNDTKCDIQTVFIKEDNDLKPPQSLKLEKTDQKCLENVKIQHGVDIILPVLENSIKDRYSSMTCGVSKMKTDTVDVLEDSKCKICLKVLPNMYVYNRHMNEHFPNHVCELCGKGYMTQRRLKRHMSTHDKGPFECADCDAVFTNNSTYYAHRQRNHSPGHQYRCPHCPERFRTYTQRGAHLAAVHGLLTRRYCCPVCRKTFLLSGNLSQHMRHKHLKIKRHLCTQCDAAFFHKQDLTGHMATHTGKKPFQCEICSKSYPRKKSLKVHMLTHTDDKPFCCDVCGKKCTQKCALLAHMKTHKSTQKKRKVRPKVEKETPKTTESVPKVSEISTKVSKFEEIVPKMEELIQIVLEGGELEESMEEVEIQPKVEKMVVQEPKVKKVVVDVTNPYSLVENTIKGIEPDKALYNCYKIFY